MGMRGIISDTPGLIIIMEFWPHMLSNLGFPPDDLLQQFLDLDYQIQIIDERRKELRKLETPTLLVQSIQRKKDYINLLLTAPS